MPNDHWNQLITAMIFQIRATQQLQQLPRKSDRIAGDHKDGYYELTVCREERRVRGLMVLASGDNG